MLVPEWVGASVLLGNTQTLPLLDNEGRLPLKPNRFYDGLNQPDLRIWMHDHARYLLVTQELVDFLKPVLAGQKTIEIGAGAGDLGRHLGIKMTDNYCQQWPEVRDLYASMGQPTIPYAHDVERIDALDAVLLYAPDIVIGGWVTQWISPNLAPPKGGGSIYGIKEDEVLKRVKKYIVIGAEEIHKHKAIMAYPHETIDATFARSRRTDNRIWIWEGRKK